MYPLFPRLAPRDSPNGNTIYARAAAYFTFYAKYSPTTRTHGSEFCWQLIVQACVWENERCNPARCISWRARHESFCESESKTLSY